tara:strand:- start:530 stop:892 length:363 start_codon:yes stop_codon:yes gene_type:complete
MTDKKMAAIVARGIAEANPQAGQPLECNAPQDPTGVRAQRLLDEGYVRGGAHGNADQSGCAVTVYLEGSGRCLPPWGYWDDMSGVSIAASTRIRQGTEKGDRLAGFLETLNPGCAAFYLD